MVYLSSIKNKVLPPTHINEFTVDISSSVQCKPVFKTGLAGNMVRLITLPMSNVT